MSAFAFSKSTFLFQQFWWNDCLLHFIASFSYKPTMCNSFSSPPFKKHFTIFQNSLSFFVFFFFQKKEKKKKDELGFVIILIVGDQLLHSLLEILTFSIFMYIWFFLEFCPMAKLKECLILTLPIVLSHLHCLSFS